MDQPSFIRTVTAGTGFPPVHAHYIALVGYPFFRSTTGRELGCVTRTLPRRLLVNFTLKYIRGRADCQRKEDGERGIVNGPTPLRFGDFMKGAF
jgi:hypothetical protein